MPTEEFIGVIGYDRPKLEETIATNLQIRSVFNRVSGTQVRIDSYLNPDGDVVRQEDTITIDSLGNAGDVVGVTIDDGTDTLPYAHIQQTGDTTASIASHLARLIDSSPAAAASASGSTITVTGVLGGQPLTFSDITDPINGAGVTIANLVTASGSASDFKIAEQVIDFGLGVRKGKTLPSLQIDTLVSYQDFSENAVKTFSLGGAVVNASVPFLHEQTLDQIQVDAGVNRSNS